MFDGGWEEIEVNVNPVSREKKVWCNIIAYDEIGSYVPAQIHWFYLIKIWKSMSLSYGDESTIRAYFLVVGMGWDAWWNETIFLDIKIYSKQLQITIFTYFNLFRDMFQITSNTYFILLRSFNIGSFSISSKNHKIL